MGQRGSEITKELYLLKGARPLLRMCKDGRSRSAMRDHGGLDHFAFARSWILAAGSDFNHSRSMGAPQDRRPVVVSQIDALCDLGHEQLRHLIRRYMLSPMPRRIVFLQMKTSRTDDISTGAPRNLSQLRRTSSAAAGHRMVSPPFAIPIFCWILSIWPAHLLLARAHHYRLQPRRHRCPPLPFSGKPFLVQVQDGSMVSKPLPQFVRGQITR